MKRGQVGRRLRLVLLALAPVATGCAMSADQERAVRTWLECVDCGEEVLAVVDSLADFNTETALILAIAGPPDTLRTRVARHLRSSYRMAKRELGEIATRDAEDAYVRARLAGFVANYQWRAVSALGRIGTPRTRRALRWALIFESRYPPHVATEIRTQLADSIVAVTATLDSLPVTAEAVDPPTVRVYRGNSPWAGAAVTFATRGMGRVRGAYAMSDADGRAGVSAWYADSAPGENVLVARVPNDTLRFSLVGIY